MTALHASLGPWHDDDDEWSEEESLAGPIQQELELQGMNDVSSANQVLQQHPSKLLHCTTYPLSTIVRVIRRMTRQYGQYRSGHGVGWRRGVVAGAVSYCCARC